MPKIFEARSHESSMNIDDKIFNSRAGLITITNATQYGVMAHLICGTTIYRTHGNLANILPPNV